MTRNIKRVSKMCCQSQGQAARNGRKARGLADEHEIRSPDDRQSPAMPVCRMPQPVLCSEFCVERRKRTDPHTVPQPKNPN